jgi:hypothetical protein
MQIQKEHGWGSSRGPDELDENQITNHLKEGAQVVIPMLGSVSTQSDNVP